MKKWICAILFLFSIVNTAFCDDSEAIFWKPEKVVINNELYNMEMEPIRIPYQEGWGPKAFKVKILNKHSKDIEILWKDTCFLINGKLEGVFYTYKDKKKLNNETIPPQQSIERNIAPAYLLRLDMRPIHFFSSGSWQFHTEFPVGKNGMLLYLLIDNKRIAEQVEIDFILK